MFAYVDEPRAVYLHTARQGRDYRAISAQEMKRTAVYRIDIDSWSGKEKFVEPDFPGAYDLPDLPVPLPLERKPFSGP